jgi:glycosyltransferase involved in cell wall biosynthesis
MTESLVGIVGGSVGSDPFHRLTWSGSSSHLFSELKCRDRLHRAFGVKAAGAEWLYLLAKNVSPNRTRWWRRFYSDPSHKTVLTKAVERALKPEDLEHPLLQIGAMFNVSEAVRGRARCYSLHDGNLAIASVQGWSQGLSGARLKGALEYERRLYSSVTRVFATSEYLRQSFISYFEVPAGNVVTVGAGINMEIPQDDYVKDYSRREILFIGVDFERKGGLDLLAAFRGVLERYPDARLHIVGPHALQIPARLAKGVTYHGYLDRSQPPAAALQQKLFKDCSVFAMPSKYEPFGLAPLEAMVHRIPAVVTRDWALKEMVTPGEHGDTVPAGDVDALSASLICLLSSPDDLRRMGESGRRMVQQKYTWERVVDRLLSAIAADRVPAR